jgi:poly(3-hydroxyalkanoate) synthetase
MTHYFDPNPDPLVDCAHIAVRNVGGDVTLTGTVPSYPQYLQAAAAARRVCGVTHIAALVNPPGNPKATYQTSETSPASPQDWLKAAQSEHGSWWSDMLAWLGERCGADKPAPAEPGGGGYGRSP